MRSGGKEPPPNPPPLPQFDAAPRIKDLALEAPTVVEQRPGD